MKTASDTEEVASWTYDLDSRQLLWSEGCYRFFGLGATRCGDEMETWKSLIDSRDRNRWDSAFHEFLQGNKPIMELGVRLVKPRSDVVIVRAIASKKKNQLMGLYELASEDMLSKDATELDEDSKSADRMKTEFLTVMSHEIRTPMNGIMGFTNLLSSTTLTKDQRLYVDTIESSGNALMTILNDVLDFSKIEAGKMLIEPIPIELKSLVTDVFVLHEPSATCKDVDMTLDLQESLPNLLICDAVRVRQILGNLVGNAIKFTDNGFIRISVFGKKQHESWSISLKITDSGIGMTEECKRRLFKPFTQGDSSESRRFGGTGLGLAISYHLCRLMGGNIHVQSRLGEGSTFTATFIASEAENNCVLPEETSCLSPRKLRVLVADDNKINRDLIGRLLNKLGHHATMAEDGENVLQIWKTNQNKFDIIMTDLQMPGKTGFEAASAIRSFEREQDNASSIPIIAVTADATGGTKAMCFECGMNDLLTKPLSLQDLKRVLKKWSSDS
jgi:signal transduction histidine kinase/ActR/RegA family two-component response regulator